MKITIAMLTCLVIHQPKQAFLNLNDAVHAYKYFMIENILLKHEKECKLLDINQISNHNMKNIKKSILQCPRSQSIKIISANISVT